MTGFDETDYERDYPRETLHTKAEILVDEQLHPCRVDNISASGARLITDLVLARGKDLLINIGVFGPFNATVAWCNGGMIGVKFDHDPEEMNKVILELESRG